MDIKKILLVEDDGLLNKTLTYNLISEGYDTASALNAGAAAELLTQPEYDLVLLDINLPDGSGYDLCRLIKPENPDTLVIFLTANDQESDQIRGYEVGAVDYITKPFSIGALLWKIRAMFAMLEHRGMAKDFYDDGRLFLDFSEQNAALNGKTITLSRGIQGQTVKLPYSGLCFRYVHRGFWHYQPAEHPYHKYFDPEAGTGRFAGGWPEQQTAFQNAFDRGAVLYILGTAYFRVVWNPYGASSLYDL